MDAPPSVFRTQLRPPRPFEPARIPGPASSDLNYATRSSRWRVCLCLCNYFVFFFCHCLCLYLRTRPVKSQAFNLLLSDPRGKKRLILISTSTTSQDSPAKEISGKNGSHMVPNASLLCERVEWINRSSGRKGQALKPLNRPHSGR